MKGICIIFGVAVVCAFTLAQDTEIRWPENIRQADVRYERTMTEAHAVRQRVYQRELEVATRSGNLDLANAIKERMKGFESGNTSPSSPISNTKWFWDTTQNIMWFAPDGTLHYEAGGWRKPGVWRATTPNVIQAITPDGRSWEILVASDRSAFVCFTGEPNPRMGRRAN